MSTDRVEDWLAEAERDRAATAFHEAGHVTAAVLLGLPVARGGGATIAPCPGAYGLADFGCSLSPTDLAPLFWASAAGETGPARLRRRFESEVLAIMLGPLAEERARAEKRTAPLAEAPRWRRVGDDADALSRELAYREAVLVHGAVSAAARDAGEPMPRSDSETIDRLLLAACMTEAEARAYATWLGERALTLLRHPRFWIPCLALAETLLEDETVDGRRCVRIVRADVAAPAAPEAVA